jgi:hypothetical protein
MSEEIRRVFDEMLAPPHPALGAMVRARLETDAVRNGAGAFARFARFGAAAVAILIVGALSLGVLYAIANRGQQQPGRNGVATSPSPSPSASPSPPRAANASCAATYTVNGNVLTVTIVTDGAPILGSFSVTDQLGDQGFNQASNIQRGQTTLQRSVNVSPPVIRVEISLESINHSFDPILCVATPAG